MLRPWFALTFVLLLQAAGAADRSPAALWRDFEREYNALADECFDEYDALNRNNAVLFGEAMTPADELEMRQALRDMGLELPQDRARRCFRPLGDAVRDGLQ